MRSVKYREFDIPIFKIQSYNMDKILRDTEHLNYWLKHPQLYDVDVSFFVDDIDSFDESVLSNLNNEHVLFDSGYFYQLMYIVDYVSNVGYTIADCENIGGTINVVNYSFKAEISDLDYNSVLRCIKIQNILNH